MSLVYKVGTKRYQDIVVAMVTHLGEIGELVVCRRLLLRQQDAVPRGPFCEAVPAHKDQVVEVLPCTQDALAVPDVLHQIAEVLLLCRDQSQ